MFWLGAEPGMLDLCPYPCSSIARNAARSVTRHGKARARVGWTPCICTHAREADEQGRGMGQLRVQCHTCHEHHWQTVAYEPPHNITAPSLR
jgi:hypothetical protein